MGCAELQARRPQEASILHASILGNAGQKAPGVCNLQQDAKNCALLSRWKYLLPRKSLGMDGRELRNPVWHGENEEKRINDYIRLFPAQKIVEYHPQRWSPIPCVRWMDGHPVRKNYRKIKREAVPNLGTASSYPLMSSARWA
nr:MAG TPA: hypothetical protein [Caudoviricetes sp.]